jgi:hypothetical protein
VGIVEIWIHPKMTPIKKNSCDDAVAALEAALRIIEQKSQQKADAGATLWVKPNGESICVRLSPDDAAKIQGAVFLGGSCKDALKTLNGKKASHL